MFRVDQISNGSAVLFGGMHGLDFKSQVLSRWCVVPPGGAGVLIANPHATHVSIIANTIGNMIDELGHQKTGISFNNGTNSSNMVAANIIDKNEDAKINWGATGCTLAVCPQEGPTKFVNLGFASNGTTVYCPDCTVAAPRGCMNSTNVAACTCTAGGRGAFAKRVGGHWLCN